MDAYSYTTLVVEPDGAASVNVTLRPDEQVSLMCIRDRGRAQLSIRHARADVIITPTNPTAPTAEDLAVARRLSELFARYAAEVERLHVAAQSDAPAA